MIFLILLFFLFSTKFAFAADSDIAIYGFSEKSPEYVELINNSDVEVNLDGWLIKDDNDITTDDIYLTSTDIIGPRSTKQFINPNDSTWLNDTGDIIYLYHNEELIDSVSYPTATPTKIPTSTPTVTPTKIPTVTSTITPTKTPTITPTSTITPTPTSTPTITPTLTIKPTSTPTDEPIPTAVIEPFDTAAVENENQPPTITQIPIQESVLGDTTTSKKNPLPIIFICIGGLFLLTPLIISKIKHEN